MTQRIDIQYDSQGAAQVEAEMRSLEGATDNLGKSLKKTKKEAEESDKGLASFGASAVVVANQAMQLGGQIIGAAQAFVEFAAEGAAASAIGDNFAGSLSRLQNASANSIDDTTLQRMSEIGSELGLQQREIDGILRKAAVLADRGLGDAAEIAMAALNGEREALRKVGFTIDETAPQFQGLSEEQKKLQTAIEFANEGLGEQVDALDSAATKMAQAQTAAQNLESTLQQSANIFLENTGLLGDMSEAGTQSASALDLVAAGLGKGIDFGTDAVGVITKLYSGYYILDGAGVDVADSIERVLGGTVDTTQAMQRLRNKAVLPLKDAMIGQGREINKTANRLANITQAYIGMAAAQRQITSDIATSKGKAAGKAFADQAKFAKEVTQAIKDYKDSLDPSTTSVDVHTESVNALTTALIELKTKALDPILGPLQALREANNADTLASLKSLGESFMGGVKRQQEFNQRISGESGLFSGFGDFTAGAGDFIGEGFGAGTDAIAGQLRADEMSSRAEGMRLFAEATGSANSELSHLNETIGGFVSAITDTTNNMAPYIEQLGRVEAGSQQAAKAQAQLAMAGAEGLGAAAKSFAKDAKTQAIIGAAIETAKGISYSVPPPNPLFNPGAAAGAFLAAGAYATAAATARRNGGGGGGGGSAASAVRRPDTALTRPTRSINRQGETSSTNIIIQNAGDPQSTGEWIANNLNRASRKGVGINEELVRSARARGN